MDSSSQKIPEALIYEMDDGQPIYYKGYEEFISGGKEGRDVFAINLLQSSIITQLIFLLGDKLSQSFLVLTNQVGIELSKQSWRCVDIAIVDKVKAAMQKDHNKYLEFAPEAVIEIDIKASLDEISSPSSYFHKKTDQLLEFGIKKVIWIFTDSKKVMVAEPNRPWQTFDWDITFEVFEGIEANISIIV